VGTQSEYSERKRIAPGGAYVSQIWTSFSNKETQGVRETSNLPREEGLTEKSRCGQKFPSPARLTTRAFGRERDACESNSTQESKVARRKEAEGVRGDILLAGYRPTEAALEDPISEARREGLGKR